MTPIFPDGNISKSLKQVKRETNWGAEKKWKNILLGFAVLNKLHMTLSLTIKVKKLTSNEVDVLGLGTLERPWLLTAITWVGKSVYTPAHVFILSTKESWMHIQEKGLQEADFLKTVQNSFISEKLFMILSSEKVSIFVLSSSA